MHFALLYFFYYGDILNTKSGYLSSAFLMLLSSLIVKAIGAIYKIPLTAFIGAVGRGYFATAYNLCLPVHIIILGSLPVALSRLCAKYSAGNNSVMLYSLKKSSLRIFCIVGICGMALVMLLARPYSIMVSGTDNGTYTILVLAPSILFSSLAASYQSYYQGLLDMRLTSVSQLIDAVFKMVFGLVFARWTMAYLYNAYLNSGCVLGTAVCSESQALSQIYPLTSAAAMLGAALGAFSSYVYSFIYDSIHREKLPSINPSSVKLARSELLAFAFPILVSCAVQSVFQFLDTATIQYSLKSIDAGLLAAAYSASGICTDDIPTYAYGIYSAALDFKNLITGVTMALGVCAVPAISRECELGSDSNLSSLVNSIYKYTVLLSLLGGAILYSCADDILNLFYYSSAPDIANEAVPYVKGFALTIVLYCLAGTAVFTVQAIGCPEKSIMPYAVSGVIRIVLNIALVKGTELLLIGAVVSGAVGYLVMCVMNIVIASHEKNIRFDLVNVILKPALIFAVILLCTECFKRIYTIELNIIINLLIKIMLCCVIFCILCFLCKSLKFSEIFLHLKPKKTA